MSLREQIVCEMERLPEAELQYVSDRLAFLEFKARRKTVPVELPDSATLAALYFEFADEDRLLADEGMAEYATFLATEDSR